LYIVVMSIGHRRADGGPVPLYKILAMEQDCKDVFCTFSIGGMTTALEGFYKSIKSGLLLDEPCSVILSATLDISDADWQKLIALASRAATQLQQESVFLARFGFGRESKLCLVSRDGVLLEYDKSSRVQVTSWEEKYAS